MGWREDDEVRTSLPYSGRQSVVGSRAGPGFGCAGAVKAVFDTRPDTEYDDDIRPSLSLSPSGEVATSRMHTYSSYCKRYAFSYL